MCYVDKTVSSMQAVAEDVQKKRLQKKNKIIQTMIKSANFLVPLQFILKTL